ncbi:hypothetical protein [Enterococcus cecorum]|uniref:hypothetical protein n=1 Tax=Enterococcus cecorum TaxID=44008 RepID=UPI0032C4A383
MNGKATAETIKMLVQANNTIADVLEMLAVESKRLENKGLPTEYIEELDKVRNRISVMRYDFTDTINKLVEEVTNTQEEKPIYTIKQSEPMGNNGKQWEM